MVDTLRTGIGRLLISRHFVAGMSLQSLQQLTGANYFFYYGATIFQSVGISDSFVTQIILGAVNFICTFGGLYVMEKVLTSCNQSDSCCTSKPLRNGL